MEYHIDAANKILGRLATDVAMRLRGKNHPSFNPGRLSDNKVTVFNTDLIRVTGKKLEGKVYLHHSGFQGGQKAETLARLMIRDSRLAVRRAVMGMLPKNRLRAKIIRNLTLLCKEDR